jgi:16S rRNA (uracil1498-N3)-methyltransferase
MDALFYAPGLLHGDTVLDASESHHCISVRRHAVGDIIRVFDGSGGLFEAELTSDNPRGSAFRVMSETHIPRPHPRIHLAVAPTKNVGRFEWMVEKVVEIGVSKISPLKCERSERNSVNTERLRRIVIEAAKQSGKLWLPELDEMKPLNEITETNAAERLIAHMKESSVPIKSAYRGGSNTVVLIGPEGDFTPEEVELALRTGFTAVNLGHYRLRTETAAVVACSAINLLHD